MCGICGIAGFNDSELLKKMSKALEHRGPDEDGVFIDDKIGLASRRLSIIDLKTGKQPIHNEKETVWTVFNGEIYNFKELKEELENKGHKFYTETDTEVIVHAYEEYGKEFVKKFDGMFAIALWDSEKKLLFLARDPFGIKPLYYSCNNNTVVFASEIKALLEYEDVDKTIDKDAVSEFLALKFSLNEKTVIRGIKKLMPGCFAVFKKWLKVMKYFEAENRTKSSAGVLELLKNSVEKQLISDVPVGAFLSGGIDSSSIVALMSELSEKPVETFTVGFGDDNDEFKFAREVSEKFNTNHNELVLSPEQMAQDFKKVVKFIDEPVADMGMMPFFFLSEHARKKIKVVLLGEGADELFAGYPSYWISKFNFMPAIIKNGIYSSRTQIFSFKERKILLGQSFKTGPRDFSLKGLLKFDFSNLANYQLTRVDRMSMANSLEARVPFLQKDIVNFAVRIPDKQKISGFKGKVVLRDAMKKVLPKSVLNPKKRIFITPGYYPAFRGLINETLSNPEFFSRTAIDKFKFNSKNFMKSWTLTLFELWFRQLNL